jgi:hypothetical protein
MAIARNSSADLGLDTGGTNPYLANYTCGSGSLRLLAGGLFSTSSDGTATLKYNGVTQTVVDTNYNAADRGIYSAYLLAPSTGTNVYRVDWVSGPDHVAAMCADYTGVLQSGQPDAHNTGAGNNTLSIAVTITVVAANSWVFAILRENGGTTITWTNMTELQANGNGLHIADSNGPVSAGTYIVTATSSILSTMKMNVFSFAPDTGGAVTDAQEWITRSVPMRSRYDPKVGY